MAQTTDVDALRAQAARIGALQEEIAQLRAELAQAVKRAAAAEGDRKYERERFARERDALLGALEAERSSSRRLAGERFEEPSEKQREAVRRFRDAQRRLDATRIELGALGRELASLGREDSPGTTDGLPESTSP